MISHEEGELRTGNLVLLAGLGLAIWIIGTVYYAHAGPAVLESTGRRYWMNFAALPVLSAVLCLGILRWRQIPETDWATATLLIALPGMVGEALVLSNFSTFMPKLQISSGGRYGAFLFMTYAVVLGAAELVTLKSR